MAFIVAKRPVVAAPIKFAVYDEAGKRVEIEFVAHYHRHTSEQLADLQDGLVNRSRALLGHELITRADGSAVPDWPFAADVDFIVAKVAGWRDVQDEQGNPRAFSEEALREIMADWPEVVQPLFQGFFEAHRGARQKN